MSKNKDLERVEIHSHNNCIFDLKNIVLWPDVEEEKDYRPFLFEGIDLLRCVKEKTGETIDIQYSCWDEEFQCVADIFCIKLQDQKHYFGDYPENHSFYIALGLDEKQKYFMASFDRDSCIEPVMKKKMKEYWKLIDPEVVYYMCFCRNSSEEFRMNSGVGEQYLSLFGVDIKEDGIHISRDGYHDFIPNKKGFSYYGFFVSPSRKRLRYYVGNGWLKIGVNEVALCKDEIAHDSVPVERILNVKNYHTFRLTIDNSKQGQILFHYLKKKGNYRIVSNLFEDDSTLNVEVDLSPESAADDFSILYHFSQILPMCIYGISVRRILYLVEHESSLQWEREKVWSKDPDATFLKNEIEASKNIFNLVKKHLGFSENQTAQYLFDHYIDHSNLFFSKYPNGEIDIIKQYSDIKSHIDDILDEMIESGTYKARWKSELEMYKMIKKLYPDAIYQYRATFLGAQSLDVYVPSIQTAFEYQGKQHYEPIDFFGGKDALEHLKKLDIEKKQKCFENGIALVEWKYNEPITNVFLRRKLEIIELNRK